MWDCIVFLAASAAQLALFVVVVLLLVLLLVLFFSHLSLKVFLCFVLNLVNYRELSIIFAEIIDNSITKKMAKLSIIYNANFR
jgi:hypothetical protein